jgi:unsaturated chondroitin disaccharide hydrolase
MKNSKSKSLLLFLAFMAALFFCNRNSGFAPDKELDYCVEQLNKAIPELTDYEFRPRLIGNGESQWSVKKYNDWTAGFWPGILWYAYEYTNDDYFRVKADSFTRVMTPLSLKKAHDHDLGFKMFCSFGNAYRITGDPVFKEVIIRSADSLARLINPKVGTMLSWPWKERQKGWPHNTIIDNMMNLELLFWASKNGGDSKLYDLAVEHATKTMQNHFREDYTSYHVVVYDTITGAALNGVTEQGYSDSSMWARGQAWGVYGFTMVARETGNKEFLDFAVKIANVFSEQLPSDYIPYWDFDAPEIPDAPRDASAAAIFASALLELSVLISDSTISQNYKLLAEIILQSLSSKKYQSREKNVAFLSYSTDHKPNESEVNVSLIYADYYYIEALTRLRKIIAGRSIYE